MSGSADLYLNFCPLSNMASYREILESAMLLSLLVRRLGGSLQKSSTDCFQWTQFVLNHIPYNWQIDTEILMNENVA